MGGVAEIGRGSRSCIADPCIDYSAAWRNVDGARTIGVSFFGTDRCLSGCALFIVGLYVLPYKDGILGRVFWCVLVCRRSGLWCFSGQPFGHAQGGRHHRLSSAGSADSMYACMYVHICAYAYMRICMCVCVHACMYACMHVWSCGRVGVHVCMYVCVDV